MIEPEQWLTVGETAARLGTSEEMVRRKIREGSLPALRLTGAARAPWMVNKSSIGAQVRIHPSAVIDRCAHIGPGTTIGPRAVIASGVFIGANCVIGPGVCIGQDGFGYVQDDATGRWDRKPQSHGVFVDDDVHIGANTCIDRGSYRDTTIGRGTRIDNLCHIAHNVVIGEDCLIIALSMLAGSVEVGDGAYVAPCAAVREHTTLGAGAFVGLGAVVVSDVADGEHVKGVPAKNFQPSEASRVARPARRGVAA